MDKEEPYERNNNNSSNNKDDDEATTTVNRREDNNNNSNKKEISSFDRNRKPISDASKEIKKEMDKYEESIKSAAIGGEGAQDEVTTSPPPPEGDPTRSEE